MLISAAVRLSDAESPRLPEVVLAFLPDNPDLPAGMVDLMRNSRLKYLEGSNLIKSGESTKARAAFNNAVDLVLESDWDLSSNAELNRFFQDLIRRIQQDESTYLSPPDLADEKAETAVVDELEKLDLIPITVDPRIRDAVEADLTDSRYDIPITLNERVLKSLNYWLDTGRKYFIDGMLRSGRYREMIERIFREQSIPNDVMYLAQVESLFKTNALSHALAKGIWQFTRNTAVRYGLKVNSYIDERSDPEKSTIAAARYLNDLYAMFKDWNLVLAAYNCGEGKVLQVMDKSGLDDFWDLVGLRRNLPAETQNHVPLIMASIILARNPEKYGLPKELEPALKYDKLTVSKPVDLREAAKVLNVSLDVLKALNPALRSLSTPPAYPDFKLNVPAGVGHGAAEKVAALPAARIKPPAADMPLRLKVRSGDTLDKIARRYGISVTALRTANRIRTPKTLRSGMYLQIPSTRIKTANVKSSAPNTATVAIKQVPGAARRPVATKVAASAPANGKIQARRAVTPAKPAIIKTSAPVTKKPAEKQMASR
jgi:membrane-bound lytic murein transglycosylase D